MDSLKGLETKYQPNSLRPFNPNFISDYKGYVLGLSAEELDRLYRFREQERYICSAREFQEITKVSDSLLTSIKPYLSFPQYKKRVKPAQRVQKPFEIRDLNTASAAELQTISGIGPVLSERIVKFRTRLGGFALSEQLLDVYGLEEEVARRAMKHFHVLSPPAIQKLSLNSATVEELAALVYLDWKLAKRIVAYRIRLGRFDSIAQLTKIEEFPTDRIDRIKLYLAL
jgi:competence ComEA-like helix-hairpin-helix protein